MVSWSLVSDSDNWVWSCVFIFRDTFLLVTKNQQKSETWNHSSLQNLHEPATWKVEDRSTCNAGTCQLPSNVRNFVKFSFFSLKAGITTRKGGEQSGLGFFTKSQRPRMAGTSKNYSLTAATEHSTATESWCFTFFYIKSV